MGKTKFYALMMSLTVGLTSIYSCSSDDDNDNDDVKVQESVSVTTYDQVKYFQDNIVEIDSLGVMVQRVNGMPLNSADTTELSIGVENLDAAAEMFKSWLSPDTKVELSYPSTVNMQASLKDEAGDVKETVYFKAVESEGKNVAEVTFASDGVFKHFSKVVFVKSSAWPDNASFSPYSVGDLEKHDTYEDGKQYWVCVREAKVGVSGLMVYISADAWILGQKYIKNLASPSTAKTVSSILKSDWNTYVKYFSAAGRTLDKDSYYWINDWKYFFVGGGIYAIRLSDGDIDWFDIVYHRPYKHFLQVRSFGLVEVKD